MLKQFILSAILILSGIAFYVPAQTITPKFDEITIAIPNCVLQDKNGFIWIGSQEGLIRYDGNTLKKYQNIPFDSTSISANWVTTLAEDNYGNLWVGTISGLNYYNQITEEFSQYILIDQNDSTISSKSISKIIVNEDGSLWIGTTDRMLFYTRIDITRRTQETIHYQLDPKDAHSNNPEKENWIFDIYKDDGNCLWIGTMHNGLIKYNTKTGDTKHFTHDLNNPYSLSHNIARSICTDSMGNIWIGTGFEVANDGGGLNMFDTHTEKFIHFQRDSSDPTSLISDRVFPILIDRMGTFWMGFYNRGIGSINVSELLKNKKPDFRKLDRYSPSYIQNIYEDNIGNVWFAQLGWNLYKYDRRQNPFYYYHRVDKSSNTMSSSGIESIYIDHFKNIWFGHHTSGLDKYVPKTGIYKNYLPRQNNPDFLNSGMICGIQEDSSGFLWIATMNDGLYKMDPFKEKFQKIVFNYDGPSKRQIDLIRLILMSKSGKLYIGTIEKGLFLFDLHTNHLKAIDINQGKVENVAVSSLLEDHEGTLWLGTLDNGFYGIKFVDDEVKNVVHYFNNPSDRNSLSYNSIMDIIRPEVVDTTALWIATANGLNRFDLESKSFTHFFKKDGIPDNLTLKILEDNQGNIWVACAIGIGRYDIKTRHWKSFDTGDGMPFESFGGCRQNTAKSKDGQLFFSGIPGTIGFFPEQIKDNPIIPPIKLIDFKIFNESIKLDTSILFKKSITLSHDQNAFSFEFAALNYSNPGKNQYAYKMEGFNDNWIYSGNEHTASFTNLDPGKYIFRVKGSNNQGVWNEEGATLSIIILPPWWATWWFRTLMILTLIGIGYSIYRYRINKVLEMERLRVQIASDLHDDIGSALTKIAIHSEIIQTTSEKEKVSRSSQKIGSMSREIITTLSDVVWSIDSRNDTVGYLIDRMRDFLETVFPAGSIHIDFQTKGLHFDQKIDQALRQNIYLIFKEAVNNAAKHSRADEIHISMINGDGKFKMEIADNGAGINEDRKQKGHHGIENMELRAKRINGELIIQNLEKGTKVSLIAKNI